MIEKLLEANIVSAIEALNLPGLAVRGAWQAAEQGGLKDEEGSTPAALAVHVSPRTFENFGLSICTMDVSFALVVRTDLCPNGTELETYADPILALLQNWNLNLNCENDCGLSVNGFAPGGIQITGGEGPSFDRDSATWAISFQLSIRGCITETNQ